MKIDYKCCPRDGEVTLIQLVDPDGTWRLIYDGLEDHQFRHEVQEITGRDLLGRW